jgi:uncharacterized Fe-S cluster-containing protein
LDAEVAVGAEGWLELHVFGRVHRVEAVVANLEPEDVGFCFRAQTQEEIQTLRGIVSEVGGLSWID